VIIVLLFAFLARQINEEIGYSVMVPSPTKAGADVPIQPLRIVFDQSVARIDLSGKDLPDGVHLEPALKGRWSWTSDTELIFFSEEAWACGQSFKVVMSKNIFAKNVKLKSFVHQFWTDSFSTSIDDSYFHIDPIDDTDRRIMASISFNYSVDSSSVENRIALKVVSGKY
jgi:hypothetical protein